MGLEISAYAPAAGFELTSVEGSCVLGLAYPRQGPACSALKLLGGGQFLGAVRADGFSKKAAARKLRDGWCQFSIQLDRGDFIFSDDITLSCLATGKTLGSVSLKQADPGVAPAQRGRRRSVKSLIHPDRRGMAAAEADQYFPLIERTAASLPDREFLSFAFRLLFNREPDADDLARYMKELDKSVSRAGTLRLMTSSSEFKSIDNLPSPFDEAFPGIPVFAPLRFA